MEHNLPPNIRQLIELLGSPDSDLRIFAASKLATLDCRDDKVRLALENATRDDPDLFVREEARSALGQLGFPIPERTVISPTKPAVVLSQKILAAAPSDEPPQAPAVYDINEVSFGSRLAAFILDTILIGLASSAVSFLGQAMTTSPVLAVILGLFQMLLPGLYFIWAYSSTGQTVGKKIIGIKVISVDGMPLSWTQGILRCLGYLVSGLPFYLGFLWAAWDTNWQAWHDKIAGTYVVKVSYEFQPVRGAVRSKKEFHRQKRWLIGLGAPILLFITTGAGLFFFYIQKSIAEVQAMAPWPAPNAEPAYLVNLDLSTFGLAPSQIVDAKDHPWSKDISYQKGVYREYMRRETSIVFIWALRYSDRQTAKGDYALIEAWSKESGGQYRTSYTNQAGIIHIRFNDYYSKVFWNDRWIVVIDAAVGTEYDPQTLVDKVRDVMAANWREQP